MFEFYDGRVQFDLPHPREGLLYLLQGVAFFIFLTGCFSVMVLVLGRVNQKCHELSIRQAMGAGMVALRQLELAESVLLTTLTALAGIAIAWQGAALVNG